MQNFPKDYGYYQNHMDRIAERFRLEQEAREAQEAWEAAGEALEAEFRSFLNTITKVLLPIIREEQERIMATAIGKVDKKALAQNKIKPVDKTPAPLRKGKKMKADRTVKALKQNREGKR